MRIIQTFWTGHSKIGDNPFDLKAGWLSCEYHWMSWALSCLQLKKFYSNIELITDSKGKKILIDTFNLPYTSVSTALENSLDEYPAELWSLAKIFSYSIQKEAFIHLDGDVFLWHPLDDKFMDADISAQNLEVNLAYYEQSLKEINKHFSYFPQTLKQLIESDVNIYASNAGIFGGKDIPFIKSYCEFAFAFIDKNIEKIDKVNKVNLNFIFEQCFLYYLVKSQNRSISYLIKEPVTEPSYINYARFIDIPHVKMIHTVGGYKRMVIICDHLAKRLRKDYPEYYYRIISVCRENNIKLNNPVYYIPLFNGKNQRPGFDLKVENLNNNFSRFVNHEAHRSELSKTFFRTIAAIKYIRTLNSSSSEVQDFQTPDSIDALYTTISSAKKSDKTEKLKEIFNLENRKYQLTEKLSDISFIYSLYRKDVIHYEQADNLFSETESEILSSSISVPPSVTLVELNRNWYYNLNLTSIEKFIEKKISEDASVVQAALVINPLRLSIDEIYLDQIDMVIVNICVDKIIVRDALQLIKQYFDAEEVNNGYEDYQSLILDSIKRLMYSGILCPN